MFAHDRAEAADSTPSASHFDAAARDSAFRGAMRQLAGGVCVVAHGVGEARVGLTATAVASLSNDPPSLIVCLNRASATYRGLAVGAAFGVSVLGAHQQEIADVFGGGAGVKGAERFRHGRWIASLGGAPLIADGLAGFECEVEDVMEKHTHAIVIGRVLSVQFRKHGGALVHWRGTYESLGWSDDELSRAVGLNPSGARR